MLGYSENMPESSSDAEPLSTQIDSDLQNLEHQYRKEPREDGCFEIHDETLEEYVTTVEGSIDEGKLLEKLQAYEEKIAPEMFEKDEKDGYGCFITGDDNFVIYDRENPDAWIQSDFSVEVG